MRTYQITHIQWWLIWSCFEVAARAVAHSAPAARRQGEQVETPTPVKEGSETGDGSPLPVAPPSNGQGVEVGTPAR